MKIIIIMPAYNEAATIENVVKQAKKSSYPVIVVNDCSSDNTASLAKQAGAIVLNLPTRLGAWGAIQTGMLHALNMGADFVISIDADGQHNPNDIPKLLKSAKNNDITIASCIQRGSYARIFAWKIFRIITGLKIQDVTSGFRLYNTKAVYIMTRGDSLLFDYQDIGILLLARNKKLKINEVNVQMRARTNGKSRIFSTWFQVTYYMLYTLFISFSRR